MDTCLCVMESLYCVCEPSPALLINCTPVFLPGEVREQRSLVCYSPRDGRVGDNPVISTFTFILQYKIRSLKNAGLQC